MKRHEALHVGELLKMMIDSSGDRDTFDRQKAAYLWSEIVGPVINQATIRRFVDKDTLHVYMSSAPLKNELSFALPSLIEKINEAVGRTVIKKIMLH